MSIPKFSFEWLLALFSFETFFVLFLFSPQFKNTPFFCEIPDITMLLMLVLIPWFLIHLLKTEKGSFWNQEILSFLLFSGWCLVSTLWADRTTYSISKALCFGIYNIPAFFMAYSVIGENPERLKRFFVSIILFSVWVHVEAYIAFIKSNWQIVDVLGNNYLVTGQTLGFGFILLCLSGFFLFQKNVHNQKTICTPLFLLTMFLCGTYSYIQLYLGGRGPVIAVILTLLFFYAYGFRKDEAKTYNSYFLYLLLSCVFIFSVFYIIFEPQNCGFLDRTKIVTHGLSDESISLRLEYYESAIKAFLNHPLKGLGFGGWAIFHHTQYHHTPELQDLRNVLWRHPHNIGLEVLAETGFIGGIFGIWFGVNVFKKTPFSKMPYSFLDAACVLLLGFSLFNALKSGDRSDNILFFVMSGIGCGYIKQQNSKIIY